MPDLAPSDKNQSIVIFALMLAQFAVSLDVGMVNVALPTIGEDLNVSIHAAGWVLSIFLLGLTGFMIIFGRTGDMVGHRKVFIFGLALLALGSVGSGLAVNYGMLLLTRTLQSLGAAMVSANFTALMMSTFPGEKRGQALGLAATSISLGLAVGPLAGGIICASMGWRYVFLVTSLLSIPAILLCFKFVPESEAEKGRAMNVYGSLLIPACIVPAVLVLSQARIWGWTSFATICLLIASLAAGWLFTRLERKADHPVIEPALLSNPGFTLSVIANGISYVCLAAMLFATPFFLQYFLEMSPLKIGLVICFTNGIPLLLLVPSGTLSDRIGTSKLEYSGMALVCLSLGLLALVGSELTLALVLVGAGLLGLGYGAFSSPNYSASMSCVPEPQLGVAGGIYGTLRNMGSLVGIAMASLVMGEWALKKPGSGNAVGIFVSPSFEAAVRHAYLAASIAAILGIILLSIRNFYINRTHKE